MNLLFRFANFIVQSTFMFLVRLVVILFRLLFPYFLAALRLLSALVSLSLTASVQGPGQFIDRLASDWTRRLLDLGVSRDHLDQLYNLCRFLAASLIVLGWVVATLFTVAILLLFFGYFI